jgi:peptidoglycan hydrolase-like protein with peptidoglycan-binding domain
VTGNYNDDHGLVIDFITPFSGSGGGSGLRPAGQVLGVSTTTVATSTTSIATSTLTTMPDTKPTMNESTTTPGTVLGASTFDFTKNLRYRMTDPDVGELQKALVAAGYAIPDAVTNYFGAQTLAAVKAFQKAQGLPMTGLVGVQTRAALNGINSATSSQ